MGTIIDKIMDFFARPLYMLDGDCNTCKHYQDGICLYWVDYAKKKCIYWEVDKW